VAKRKKNDPSLFDTIESAPAASNGGREGAIRSALLGGGGGGDDPIALHEAAQARYLNYALSVITARALPDVRDGL
jgi:DNA gyrase subunit A